MLFCTAVAIIYPAIEHLFLSVDVVNVIILITTMITMIIPAYATASTTFFCHCFI